MIWLKTKTDNMAPLKFGSSSKTSTFKRSAFPMQTGTAGHTTAVKKDLHDKSF